MTPPRVSAILPSYNHARYVGRAIESVLAQTRADFELIIVDDGSTDESPAIIARYQGDPRLRYQRHENAGISANFNRGATAATAPYVAYLGSDDRWHAEHLARAVAALDAHPEAGWYYARAELIDADDRPVQLDPPLWGEHFPAGDILGALIGHGQSFVPFITAVYRAAAWPCTAPFDERLVGLQDYDLFLRLAQTHPVVFGDAVDAYHRWDGRNTSAPAPRSAARFHRERLLIFDGLIERLAADAHRPREWRQARRQRARFRRHAARQLLAQGCAREALPLFGQALREQPLWPEGWGKALRAWWTVRATRPD